MTFLLLGQTVQLFRDIWHSQTAGSF